jgi:hypothetical protein
MIPGYAGLVSKDTGGYACKTFLRISRPCLAKKSFWDQVALTDGTGSPGKRASNLVENAMVMWGLHVEIHSCGRHSSGQSLAGVVPV